MLSATPLSIIYYIISCPYNWYNRLTDGSYLDILINNAGLSPPPGKERAMSEYNAELELTMAVNCIAPVLLTDLLIDSLKQTAAHKVRAIVFGEVEFYHVIPYHPNIRNFPSLMGFTQNLFKKHVTDIK